MSNNLTAKGVSTTTTPGTEQYEVFYTGYRSHRKEHCQYDYRHISCAFGAFVTSNVDYSL